MQRRYSKRRFVSAAGRQAKKARMAPRRILFAPLAVPLFLASSFAQPPRVAQYLRRFAVKPSCPRAAHSPPARMSASNASPRPNAPPLNVLAQPLQPCCSAAPMTGFFRDGFCRTDERDVGKHTVCAIVTQSFLTFSRARGNDLQTAAPQWGFAGLRHGDRWCLCVSRWKEALDANVAPPVVLAATHQSALDVLSIEQLRAHAARDGDVM
ncbi:unnamed protein product [Agarophyton chilense]